MAERRKKCVEQSLNPVLPEYLLTDLCENSGAPANLVARACSVARAHLQTISSLVLRHGGSNRHIMMLTVTTSHTRANLVYRRHDTPIRIQLYRPGNYRAHLALTLPRSRPTLPMVAFPAAEAEVYSRCRASGYDSRSELSRR